MTQFSTAAKTTDLPPLTGQLIEPGHPDYDSARTVVYGGIDGRPSAIARVADVADVVAIVDHARENDIELAIRSGGHSAAGHSTTRHGIIIDLRKLKGIDIDPAARTAWVEPGVTALELTKALAPHELIVGFGDAGSVGVSGITLGGGVGYLSRKHGLTIDSLLAAEVVTADGEVIVADDENHPDLFWALRGGGGNFGVVTRLKFRLHPLPNFTGGLLVLPATPQTIAGFVAAAQAAPEALSTIGNIMPAPPLPFIPAEHHGKLIVFGMMAFAGEPGDAEAALKPFRELATPLADMVKPGPYASMYPPEDPDYHPTATARTMYVDRIGLDEARTILGFLEEVDAPMRVAQLRVLGGAAARVASDATAYAHRDDPIMVNVAAFYSGEADKPAKQKWTIDFAAALNQGREGAYVNFVADEGPDRVRAAYPGATWDRLREIKAKYDPDNLFRLNHNIPPA